MSIRLKRLQSDYEAVRRLAHHHPRIEVEGVSGRPPDRYRLVLAVRSLRRKDDRIVVAKRHRVEVTLPATYPRDAPVCRMLTPVFHPNIAPYAICIGDHWSASEPLDLMIQRIGEMLAYQSYNIKSPLNGEAAQWVEINADKVPLEEEEFFLDLRSAPQPKAPTACANCGAHVESPAKCDAAHLLCPDCIDRCPECGTVICLACGAAKCPQCTVPACSNCAAPEAGTYRCSQGHHVCEDCVVVCESCGKTLCVLCGEYPCSCESAA